MLFLSQYQNNNTTHFVSVSEPISSSQPSHLDIRPRNSSQTEKPSSSITTSSNSSSADRNAFTCQLPSKASSTTSASGNILMHSNQSHHLKTPQLLNVARSTLTHTNKNMSNIKTTTSAKCIRLDECQCSTITTSTNITTNTTNTTTTIAFPTFLSSTNTNNANLSKPPKPVQLLSSSVTVPIPCTFSSIVVLSSAKPERGRKSQLDHSTTIKSSGQCITSCLVTEPVDGDGASAALSPSNCLHTVLSKSETNLSVNGRNVKNNVSSSPKGNGATNLAIFNVVSLNNLHESDSEAFGTGKPMNDLSKNQTLNNISNDEIHLQHKKLPDSGDEKLSKHI